MNILTVDVGTSSMRAVVMDGDGQMLCRRQETYCPRYMPGGRVEQPASDWEQTLISLCRSSAAVCRVDAIALSAQRSSVIPLDAQGQALRFAVMWQDTRTEAVCRALEPCSDEIFRRCGARPNTVYSGAKMAWLRQQEPELYRRAYKLAVIPDYLIHRMTGEFKTDHSYGSRSLLMNLRTRCWDPELLAMFGLEEEKLCELVAPGSVAGYVTAEFAALTGLRSGIPVVSSGGDQQCGALGQGLLGSGVASMNLGTGAFLLTTIPALPEELQPDVVWGAAALPGQYMIESSALCCGDGIRRVEEMLFGALTMEQLDEELEKSPAGANGVLCLPCFQGRSAPQWDPEVRGSYHGLSLATQANDILRATVEGICWEMSEQLQRMRCHTRIERLLVSGGLIKSAALSRMLTDFCNVRVERSSDGEATLRGAWMNASVALGLYTDLEQAWGCFAENRAVLMPAKETAVLYARLSRQLNELNSRLNGKGEKA